MKDYMAGRAGNCLAAHRTEHRLLTEMKRPPDRVVGTYAES